MTMIALYPSKKALAENIGQPLKYVETSFFGPEYKPDGSFSVCNRPTLPQVTLEMRPPVIVTVAKNSRALGSPGWLL